jgi:hypothetical protein
MSKQDLQNIFLTNKYLSTYNGQSFVQPSTARKYLNRKINKMLSKRKEKNLIDVLSNFPIFLF